MLPFIWNSPVQVTLSTGDGLFIKESDVANTLNICDTWLSPHPVAIKLTLGMEQISGN